MSLVPTEKLVSSSSPFADAASVVFGPWGATFITIGAIISIVGSLNGNILFTSILSQSIAKDQLFPKKFADINRFGAPAFGLIVAGLLSSLLIVMNYSKGLISAFKALILLSTLTTLLPYAVSALADIVVQNREYRKSKKRNMKSYFISFGALGFSIFTIVGAGLSTLALGLVLLLIGVVLYYLKLNKKGASKLE